MTKNKPDLVFLALAAGLVLFGLVVLTSASGPIAYQKFQDGYWYLRHQVLYGLLPGLALFLVTSNVDYRFWRRFSLQFFILGLILLLLVFLPGLSADWSSARSWINVAGLSFQPAEAAKLALLVFLAAWFERVGEAGARDWQQGTLPFLITLGLVAAPVLLQPDLGSLIIIVVAAAALFFAAGASWSHLFGLLAAAAVAFFALVKAVPYRAQRLTTFLHPELDPLGIGYHINQAYLAIGSGGLLGLGLGHSRQKYLYLPEVIGDSIFAVMAEELGFVLVIGFLILLMSFIWRGLRAARRAPDDFGRLLAVGIVAWIFFQSLFNIGSMLGLFPVTGLPLPFVSYGGTALMILLGAVGLLANIAAHGGDHARRWF
ncbi:MAG: FtsW/RodA/SpoVE family cell cycle protein [Patescibacteria group bacterium]|jgi:cell division protein FtsW